MKRFAPNIRFYGVISLLNLAVGGMFYVVTTIPPAAAATTLTSALPVSVKSRVTPIRQGVPTRVEIPSIGIDLPVGLGIYDAAANSWVVDATKAYYATTSVPINDHNGNTLIYGHAQTPVFARLPTIQVGAQAAITTDSGYLFHYTYQSMQTVLPSDVSVLHADGPPTLTLQTCMGAWDTYRGLFLFTLDSVQKL